MLLKQEADDIPRVVVLLFVGVFVAGGMIGYFTRWFSFFSEPSSLRSNPLNPQSVAPSRREPQSRPVPAPKPIAAPEPASPTAAVKSSGAAKPAAGVPTVVFRVQVGAFRRRENAEVLVQRLHRDGFQAYITYAAGLYRVRIGTFTDREDAEQLVQELREKKYKVFITR